MGDCGHNILGWKEGAALPLSRGGGELGPCLRQCDLGRGLLLYQVASSSFQPFGLNRHVAQTGGCAPFRGELWPHLVQRFLGRGLPPYQVASWSIEPFGHNRHGPKIGWGGEAVLSFLGELSPIEHKVAWAEAYLHTKWHLSPSSHLATIDIGRKLGAVPL